MTTASAPKVVRKSDFELKPFMSSCNRRATWQVVNTLVPYGLLWWLAVTCLRQGLWPLLLPVIGLMVLFMARCFSLMHDCGHYSLFRQRTTNRWVGFLLGIVAGIPQLPWSRGHAFHHRHNGNWERYKGPSALVSAAAYNDFDGGKQALYRRLRHPLMLIPGGFFYLVIKPRIELLAGLAGLVPHAIATLRQAPATPWSQILASHQTTWWHSPEEFRDLFLNNIAVVAAWMGMGWWLGAGTFWLIYAPVMAFSAAVFICIFFVQHNFPGSYAESTAHWNAMQGVMEGTSDLQLHPLLNWFSADIGCHSIHHLCEAIPNYRLQEAHRRNAHLLTGVKRLRLSDIPSCFSYILWDERAGTLTTVDAQTAS
jgi:omega-6 fatty acid desaturase (delta-12 desaturase)